MSKLFTLFILIIVAFSSCDGRDRKHGTNEEVLKENKLLDSFTEIIKYIPETYTEVITDTILSNGFRVKSKFFSIMDENVPKETKKASIHQKIFYRDFEVLITISKDGNEIFSHLIDKDFFHKHDFSIKGVLDNVVLKDFSIDEYDSTNKKVALNFDYYPEIKDRLYRYKLVVNGDGTFKVINESVIF